MSIFNLIQFYDVNPLSMIGIPWSQTNDLHSI